jgi:hypothetical protein
VARTRTTGTPPDYTSGGVTPEELTAWLGPMDPAGLALVPQVCDAVNAWCAVLPYVRATAVQLDPDLPAVVWSPDAHQGALYLAAGMHRRRNSPAGTDAATASLVYVPLRDADVDRLLRVGSALRVQVG